MASQWYVARSNGLKMRTRRIRIDVFIYRQRTSSVKVKRPLLTGVAVPKEVLASESRTDGFFSFYETRSPDSQHGLVCIDSEERNSSEIESRIDCTPFFARSMIICMYVQVTYSVRGVTLSPKCL